MEEIRKFLSEPEEHQDEFWAVSYTHLICAQSASPTAKQPGNMTVVFKMISLWMMV